ncbi:hypothetical protein O2V63_19545 [Modestobacter sp. VKM Ac-2977]|uniref:hypothetical protein n=1 Tax=Modestobacter sp. VKM Ac-2977 TaxID=3004131 RepID=UPI0022AAB5BB|nr:hypothetical protein [Modestobacter sp. VKM Ac-2977]MCZ2822536.1 hypothetical protein [Modestobacter sp. VKM Ac-2977]
MSHAHRPAADGGASHQPEPAWSGRSAPGTGSPATGAPSTGPATAAPQESALVRRPVVAVAAAVFGFQAAAASLLLVLFADSLAVVLGVPEGGDRVWWIAAQLMSCALAAMLLLGGVQLIRGTGRLLLLVATVLELTLALGGLVWALVRWPEAEDVETGLPGVAGDLVDLVIGWLVATIALYLGWLVLRTLLVLAPSVGHWLRAERKVLQASVWSEEQGQWTSPPVRRTRRAGWAVLLPIGALTLVTLLLGVFGKPLLPGLLGDAETDAGASYRGDSPWGLEFYQGGEPLSPPSAGDELYLAAADADARSCYAGDMAACDALYFASPVGDVYEWYGSSCAGRLDHGSAGGCVDALGLVVD